MKSKTEDTENPAPNPENLVNMKLTIDLKVKPKTFSQLKYLSEYEHMEPGELFSRLLQGHYMCHIGCMGHIKDELTDIDRFITNLLYIYVQLKRYYPSVLDGDTTREKYHDL